MTRGIDEGDYPGLSPARDRAPMCWVMPPCFLLGDLGFADGIEQRGLAMIDVPHDGHRQDHAP
jgi:hypothetical protein